MSFANGSGSRQRFESRGNRRGYLRRRARFTPALDNLEGRTLLSTIVVTNTNDSGAARCVKRSSSRRVARRFPLREASKARSY